MSLRIGKMAVALGLLALAACSDDQAIEPGTSDGHGAILEVTYDGQSVPVDLGSVSASAYKGVQLVRLSDVWEESGMAADRASLVFEFVAADGFKPSVKDCADLPGTVLDQGYVDPVSRNLTWDEALGYEGCYSVRDTVQMNAHAPAAGADAGGVETD